MRGKCRSLHLQETSKTQNNFYRLNYILYITVSSVLYFLLCASLVHDDHKDILFTCHMQGAPISHIYFFRFEAKKIPYYSLSFALRAETWHAMCEFRLFQKHHTVLYSTVRQGFYAQLEQSMEEGYRKGRLIIQYTNSATINAYNYTVTLLPQISFLSQI